LVGKAGCILSVSNGRFSALPSERADRRGRDFETEREYVMKKYEFTDNKIVLPNGNELKQIKALIDFGSVKAGALGGYIEKESNLSHKGSAWVSDNAMVFGNARVFSNARVFDNAQIFGYAEIYNSARVFDDAEIFGDARVFGSAWVFGDAEICNSARVFGNAQVCGSAKVYGNVWICSGARVYNDADYYFISPIGSRDDSVTFYRTQSGISVLCGCFCGTLDEFAKAVKKKHSNNEHGKIYQLLIKIAKLRIKARKEESND
jgi:carbonic anhydrase/acetyltransferase-like protein (isoleucine patch superfamily)